MDVLGKYSLYSVQNVQSEVVQNCMQMCNCFSVQECVAKRGYKFLVNSITSDNILCYICQNSAARELNV